MYNLPVLTGFQPQKALLILVFFRFNDSEVLPWEPVILFFFNRWCANQKIFHKTWVNIAHVKCCETQYRVYIDVFKWWSVCFKSFCYHAFWQSLRSSVCFWLTTVESQLFVIFVGKARKTEITTVVTWVWSSFPAFQWLKWRFMSFWRSLTCWGPHQSSKVKYSWIHVKKMEYPSLSTVNLIVHSTMWNRNVQTQTLNAWGWFYLQNWVV